MTTASIQSQVLDRIVALLGGEAAGVFRARTDEFSPEQCPFDNVVPLDETANYDDNSSVELVHSFQVRHTVASPRAVDVAADVRYVRGMKLILADPTLGGLVRFTRYVRRKWEMEGKGEQDMIALVVTYEVEFSTARNDPTRAI